MADEAASGGATEVLAGLSGGLRPVYCPGALRLRAQAGPIFQHSGLAAAVAGGVRGKRHAIACFGGS